MHVPMRTCVGCRHVRPQADLLRTRCLHGKPVPALARTHSRTVPSDSARVGRAAYLCPSRSCLIQAARRGGFARTFQAGPVTADVDALWADLSEAVNRESDLLQRSGLARADMPKSDLVTRTPSPAPIRVHQLLTLAAAMRAPGRGA
jgi:hypothetical protein